MTRTPLPVLLGQPPRVMGAWEQADALLARDLAAAYVFLRQRTGSL